MIATDVRSEALLLLEGRGMILETAREVSRILRDAGIDGAIIGGVAVVLHGHVRTTVDVDVYTPDPPELLANALRAAGFAFDPVNREFVKDTIPVHLVLPEQVGRSPAHQIEIDGIRTISLADLIDMKLRSGTSDPFRAQDIADVIGLIRYNRLGGEFTDNVEPDVRPEFRRLMENIRRANGPPAPKADHARYNGLEKAGHRCSI